ncbi:MAG: CPBP family intramembrane metalloprotease [Clostridia bacterium]|nr:CPBP family intramembrane metalloprotease [Clostridia bacterium]NCC75037.1 CPBP family intramembrane metalloprotease [Clostridia bacterium]
MATPEFPAFDQEGPGVKREFRLRTLIVPLSMILIHLLVIDIVANFYVQSYPWLSSLLGWQDHSSSLATMDIQDLILNDYPRISVFYGLFLIPLYSLILFFRRLNQRDAIWLKKPDKKHLLPALILSIGLLGVTNLLFSGLMILGDSVPAVERLMADYLEQAEAFSPALGYGWLIAGITILAPLSEELLFRGIIQGELRRAMPEWLAVVIQAALFAVFHMQAIQVLYVFLPALALGAMYAVTRSFWVPVLMHVVFNFLGSVVPAMLNGQDNLIQIVVWTEVACAVISVGVISYLRHQHQRG